MPEPTIAQLTIQRDTALEHLAAREAQYNALLSEFDELRTKHYALATKNEELVAENNALRNGHIARNAFVSLANEQLTAENNELTRECDALRKQVRLLELRPAPATPGTPQRIPTRQGLYTRDAAEALAAATHRAVVTVRRFGKVIGFKVS